MCCTWVAGHVLQACLFPACELLYTCPLLPAELSSGVQYTRVPMDLPVTDPLQGLFVGHYGPHGPEVLQLERKVIVSLVVLSCLPPNAARLRWESLVADPTCLAASCMRTGWAATAPSEGQQWTLPLPLLRSGCLTRHRASPCAAGMVLMPLPALFHVQPVHSCKSSVPTVRCSWQLQAALQLPCL